MSSRKSHYLIQVSESWIEAVNTWRTNQRMSMKRFGIEAGKAEAEMLGTEPEPYSQSAITRFFSGRVSEQLAKAVAAMTGLAVIRSDESTPLMTLWNEIGARLAQKDERLLLDLAYDLRLLAEQLERVKGRVPNK